MSYRCEICNRSVPAGQPLRRHVIYRINRKGHQEIAREIQVCPTCLDYLTEPDKWEPPFFWELGSQKMLALGEPVKKI